MTGKQRLTVDEFVSGKTQNLCAGDVPIRPPGRNFRLWAYVALYDHRSNESEIFKNTGEWEC